jgi:hypothetical protein
MNLNRLNWLPTTLRSQPSQPSLPFIESPTPTALDVARFVAMMTTAITMSASVAHLMELPAKMRYEPSLYVRLHRTLYNNFGRFAGPAESLAVVSTAALAWSSGTKRQRPGAFTLIATAAGCLAAAHGIFWSVVNPMNVKMMKWPLESIPPDWAAARDRWEYGHAVRAGLVTAGFATLIASLLANNDDELTSAD